MGDKIKLWIWCATILILSLSLVTAFQFNGTVYSTNGALIANATINITIRSITDFSVVGYNFTSTNESGWFNLTLSDQTVWMFEPKIILKNTTFNFTQLIGQNLPAFPGFMLSQLSNTLFYLKNAGTINITAINSTADRKAFNYQIKDMKTGFIVASSMGSGGTIEEVVVSVSKDRNYSIMIFPNQSMPVSFKWNNFSSVNSYNIINNVAGNISRYNVTTKTLHKQFNLTMNLPRVFGFVNWTNVSSVSGWDNFTVVPFMLEPGNIVHATYGSLPYNLSFMESSTDFHNLNTGYYNITLPAPAESASFLLFATVRNGTGYYGGFANLSLTYGNSGKQINITLYGLHGSPSNLMVHKAHEKWGLKQIQTKKQSFRAVNSTNNTIQQSSLHVEATVDYSNYGSTEFTWTEETSQDVDANFSLPLLNITGIKELNVFVNGGNYAPKKVSYSSSNIISNNVQNHNYTNISISSFNPQAIDSSLSSSQISMALYISNSTCDVPSPPSGCLIGGSSSTLEEFNPMSAILGGGDLSFRMGTGNILVHYVNVDMIASGPPDALFDSSADDRSTSSTFDNAVRFGSTGPTIYDYALVSIPYSETAGSGLDDSSGVNISIPLFYDDNWNVIWNSSANGTNSAELAGNNSHYSARQSEWAFLLNQTTCVTNITRFNSTNPCFLNTTANIAWIRIPHFSGTGPALTGTVIPASESSSTSSSGSGGGGGGTSSFWKNTFAYDAQEFNEREPLTKEYAKGDRTKIKIDSENHYVGVVDLSNKSASVNVSSTPQQAIINIGQSIKFDVTNDRIYDILILLNGILNNKANLTISPIQEKMPEIETNASTNETVENNINNIRNDTDKNGIIFAILIVLIILVAIVVIYIKKLKNK